MQHQTLQRLLREGNRRNQHALYSQEDREYVLCEPRGELSKKDRVSQRINRRCHHGYSGERAVPPRNQN